MTRRAGSSSRMTRPMGSSPASSFNGHIAPLWKRKLDHAAHMILFGDTGELVVHDFRGPAIARAASRQRDRTAHLGPRPVDGDPPAARAALRRRRRRTRHRDRRRACARPRADDVPVGAVPGSGLRARDLLVHVLDARPAGSGVSERGLDGHRLEPDRDPVEQRHPREPLELLGRRGRKQVDVHAARLVRRSPAAAMAPPVRNRDRPAHHLVGQLGGKLDRPRGGGNPADRRRPRSRSPPRRRGGPAPRARGRRSSASGRCASRSCASAARASRSVAAGTPRRATSSRSSAATSATIGPASR